MDVLTQTLTTTELLTLGRFMAWANNPVNRQLIPLAPPALRDGQPVDGQRHDEPNRIREVRNLVDEFLDSESGRLVELSQYFFPTIIAAGELQWLQERTEASDQTRRIWSGFMFALSMYHQLASIDSERRREPMDAEPTVQSSRLVTVIVHGTNAAHVDWWRDLPGTKNFRAYIDSICHDCVGAGHEFTWSGGKTDSDRQQGARLFIDWWNQEGRPRLRVIAHSHGANVVWIAGTMERHLKVASMIALGAPICFEYALRLGQIKRIENVYSAHDYIQLGGAWWTGRRGEGRTLPDSSRVSNHHVPFWSPRTLTRTVDHSDLHEEDVWRSNGIEKLL